MSTLPDFPNVVDFGREICCDLAAAEAREWLVTNGIGGFACGTVAGTLTRRYHGLLVAALPPAGHRTLLVSKIDEVLEYAGKAYELGANRWADGSVSPAGHLHIQRFHLEGTTPVWTFACGDALLEKRIWMEHGVNTTFVQYTAVRSAGPLRLAVKVLVNYRSYHNLTPTSEAPMDVQLVEGGLRVQASSEATPLFLSSSSGKVEKGNAWYRNYELEAERARGLDHVEDHFHAGTFSFELADGKPAMLVASTDSAAGKEKGYFVALRARVSRQEELLSKCKQSHKRIFEWPNWIQQLILAADQFVLAGPLSGVEDAHSIIAGYPWFSDWGRDTMIALPGLLLATGRPEIAANVLRTYALFIDRGMLPNRFPGEESVPEYNSVDAALWYFEAVRQYYSTTSDHSLLREIFPAMAQVIAEYTRGTRHCIHLDPSDGLLYAGEAGVQLTWMDAKVDNWVVTPRTGKTIEVNALWLNALASMANFATALGSSTGRYESLAAMTRKGFQRFWNAAASCCYDVIDGPQGNDASVRPNQILAVALEESPLRADQQCAVLDVCARELLTSFGLRSLSQGDPHYQGRYGGEQRQRDAAYHQGTVWCWLMGPFIQAVLRVKGDAGQALTYLTPFENHLRIHGLGSVSEIFDGDPPHSPQGCFAQAWSVAEILRAWLKIENLRQGNQ